MEVVVVVSMDENGNNNDHKLYRMWQRFVFHVAAFYGSFDNGIVG